MYKKFFHILEYLFCYAENKWELRWANKKAWVIARYIAAPMIMCDETDSKSK